MAIHDVIPPGHLEGFMSTPQARVVKRDGAAQQSEIREWSILVQKSHAYYPIRIATAAIAGNHSNAEDR
jgi:hypothetical protein